MSEYSLAVVDTDEDIVIILKPYCHNCAVKKLNILKIYDVSKQDASDLIKNYKIRGCRIKCECSIN